VTPDPLDEARYTALLAALGGDRDAADRFVRDFVQAWPARWTRLFEAAVRGDLDEVQAALLSIRSASAMIGAPALVGGAQALLDDLRTHGALDPGRLDELRASGVEATAALEARLGGRGAVA
jgi:HPt (histidine-containing phosphotransfer) domain-containing protein